MLKKLLLISYLLLACLQLSCLPNSDKAAPPSMETVAKFYRTITEGKEKEALTLFTTEAKTYEPLLYDGGTLALMAYEKPGLLSKLIVALDVSEPKRLLNQIIATTEITDQLLTKAVSNLLVKYAIDIFTTEPPLPVALAQQGRAVVAFETLIEFADLSATPLALKDCFSRSPHSLGLIGEDSDKNKVKESPLCVTFVTELARNASELSLSSSQFLLRQAMPSLSTVLDVFINNDEHSRVGPSLKAHLLTHPPAWLNLALLRSNKITLAEAFGGAKAELLSYVSRHVEVFSSSLSVKMGALLLYLFPKPEEAKTLHPVLAKLISSAPPNNRATLAAKLLIEAITNRAHATVSFLLAVEEKPDEPFFAYSPCKEKSRKRLCDDIMEAVYKSSDDSLFDTVSHRLNRMYLDRYIRLTAKKLIRDTNHIRDHEIIARLQQLERDYINPSTVKFPKRGTTITKAYLHLVPYPDLLTEAAFQERYELVEWFLNEGTRADSTGASKGDSYQPTLIYFLVTERKVDLLSQLLRAYDKEEFRKRHLNTTVKGVSPLDLAEVRNYQKEALLLRRWGAVSMAKEREKWTKAVCSSVRELANATFTGRAQSEHIEKTGKLIAKARAAQPESTPQCKVCLFPRAHETRVPGAPFDKARKQKMADFEELLKAVIVRVRSPIEEVRRFAKCVAIYEFQLKE